MFETPSEALKQCVIALGGSTKSPAKNCAQILIGRFCVASQKLKLLQRYKTCDLFMPLFFDQTSLSTQLNKVDKL